MNTVFLRVLFDADKEDALREVLQNRSSSAAFTIDTSELHLVPRSPFAYWVSPQLRVLFQSLEKFESDDRLVRVGLQTSDDFRFIRCWWGVLGDTLNERWFPIAKGGSFSRYYSDVATVVNWEANGDEIKNFVSNDGDQLSRPQNTEFYFRPGITWPLRGIRFSGQAVPARCVFSVAGKMAFAPPDELAAWLAIFNAACFDDLIAFFAGKVGGVQYEVGLIQNVPVPDVSQRSGATLDALARRGWSSRRFLDVCNEASHAFELPVLLQADGRSLAARRTSWAELSGRVKADLVAAQAEIDDECYRLYGIIGADRRTIAAGFGVSSGEFEAPEINDVDDDDVDTEVVADASDLASNLLSWCVGIAFGRFDIRLATGERQAPPEPDPFDPLPVCSPGMLTGEDGLPVDAPPEGYPLAWPLDGLLVDDPGHPRDLTSAVREVFDVVFGAEADAFWTEAAELVDPKSRDIRRWLAKGFFPQHIKGYSKSRRKAPIYWQLGTPSASYSVWLYAHRIGRDSLYQVLNDFVSPKLQAEERKLHALVQEAGPNASSTQRKELASQESFVEELRVLRDEVVWVAPLWNPDLNDGVVIVNAPLWRLVPQHKSWQKELKLHWDALCAGKYDWTQLAMHLWPERVVPKCSEDRSLAIAHDLEDVFWEQGADSKWSRRKVGQGVVEELVAERSAPAIKDALASLLNAPTTAQRGRVSRGTGNGVAG